jgi:hypothetical protein
MKHLWLAPVLFACVDEPALDEASFAVTSLVLEGEASAGAGSIEPDGAASGGAVLALATPATYAQQAFTTTGWVTGGSVRVRGDRCQPALRVDLDTTNVIPTTPITSTTWTTLAFPANLPPGNHVVKIHYRNGVAGCVLRVDHVTLAVDDPPEPPQPPEAVVVEAESAVGAGTNVVDGAASGGAYRAFAAKYQKASTTFTTVVATNGAVRVRSAGCSEMPIAKVTIDGAVKTMTPVSTSGAWVTLSLGWVSSGFHAIEFEHRFGPDNCALHFDHATFAP